MRIGPLQLRQRDHTTCGPTVAVVAGAIVNPSYGSSLSATDRGLVWFAEEQGRVHASVNRIWPRMLGTTPMGMARAISVHSRARGVRYRWRLWRGRRDRLSDVREAVDGGWPVAMLVGRLIPRHWVLIVEMSDVGLQCYEPSSGDVRVVGIEDLRRARLTGVGYPRPFAFVVPRLSTRSATA